MINEEISKFDFLSNDAYNEQVETTSLIENEDFQKQFIIDSITKPEKIKQNARDARIGGDWENRESGALNVEYNVDVIYSHDEQKEPSNFSLAFDGNNVGFSAKSSYSPGDALTPEVHQMWFDYINWVDVRVYLYSSDGDTIKFTALEKSPSKIRSLFIRKYLEPIIENKTDQLVK